MRFAKLIRSLFAASIAIAAFAEPENIIRLGNLKFAHYGAVSYMKEIQAGCGIQIQEKIFAKGIDLIPALMAGELDVAASAADAAIAGRAAGLPIYAVAGFAKGGVRLIGRAESGLKSVGQLKGKRIGVARGGAQELLLFAELAKAGLSWSPAPGKDVQIVYLGFSDLNQALEQRQIDAMAQSEPQASQAINKGWGAEILKPYGTPLGMPVRTLVMTESFYKNKPLAEKFMKCFVQATKLFIDKPTVAEQYVRGTLFKNQITADDYQDAIGNSPFTYELDESHIQLTTDMMLRYGVGKLAKAPAARDWVKTDLLQNAKKQLGV